MFFLGARESLDSPSLSFLVISRFVPTEKVKLTAQGKLLAAPQFQISISFSD